MEWLRREEELGVRGWGVRGKRVEGVVRGGGDSMCRGDRGFGLVWFGLVRYGMVWREDGELAPAKDAVEDEQDEGREGEGFEAAAHCGWEWGEGEMVWDISGRKKLQVGKGALICVRGCLSVWPLGHS